MPERIAMPDIQQLDKSYTVESRGALISLLQRQPTLRSLLLEAIPYLRRCFGDKLLQLQISAEEDEIAARVSVIWPNSVEAAEEALQSFDRNWWLANCARSDGNLIFDFELVNAV